MEAKTVKTRIVWLVVLLLGLSNIAIGQNTKYLLFNRSKDSLLTVEETTYYKIDNNLFDISRYNEIDTLNQSKFEKLSLISVKDLWIEGNKKNDSITERENRLKTGVIYVSDTRNDFFKFIYVLEQLPDCSYKRTRVWWIDY